MPIKRAQEILLQTRGISLTLAEKEKAAIELAACMLKEATLIETFQEKRKQKQLARMMDDPMGKAFTTSMTDQCFRSNVSFRIADQILYLLSILGIPKYLDFFQRCQLRLFQIVAPILAPILIPFVSLTLRQETSSVILPGEAKKLSKHMQLRRKQGVRINLNHLGEAILGENEAKRRLDLYLEDLTKPDIEYISVKISTIFSQIHLIGWDHTLEELSNRLRLLYRAALHNSFQKTDGSKTNKFVNLDMEEYRDLELTKELFKKVLSEPEFFHLSAGIVLQAYLPDCFAIQQELTEFAIERVKKGGAPIKIRIVKGANLAMEQFEASLRLWPQAPYQSKEDVDANYKKMVTYGTEKEHAKAVHLGIGSHNLFDIAYAMILRSSQEVDSFITFEMLEGMADPTRRVVQSLSKDVLLYCPVATKQDFQSAIAYLIRRLDENTGPENFLRYTFGLKPGSQHWEEQMLKFSNALHKIDTVVTKPRRTQNRFDPPVYLDPHTPFQNEPDTDFSLKPQRLWVEKIIQKWHKAKIEQIPCVIGNEFFHQKNPEGIGHDPSYPDVPFYQYSLASWDLVNKALDVAKEAQESWKNRPIQEKAAIFAKAAQNLRGARGDLIGIMMADGGKAILEADPEISEAIDFIEYYLRSMISLHQDSSITWTPKGTVLITPPWNFPISIPTGGIFAALAAGNCVIFKPAPEAVLSGWELAKLLWDAGIPKEVLQLIHTVDDPIGSRLIQDPRVDAVILTGATSTAQLFMNLRPNLELHAETGGKNALIITSLSDRDLAIKDLVQSAFGHSGQKCSAASLAILEKQVYDDPHFLENLKDATESLKVGSPWDLSSKIVPLIHSPTGDLLKALTSLEPGESWLVEPKMIGNQKNLWSPGIKLGVKPGSFMHKTELFGPVLALIRAENLNDAIQIANQTKYGLTSGISTLDPREQSEWLKQIVAGNLYINRTTTGAIVHRQPFGGCKASCFGYGAKAGGPNYILHFGHMTPNGLPFEIAPTPDILSSFAFIISGLGFSAEELGLWYASISNYAYWIDKFPSGYNVTHPENLCDFVVGQDNGLYYRSRKKMALRISSEDQPIDILRVIAAAIICHTPLEISYSEATTPLTFDPKLTTLFSSLTFTEESDASFLNRLHLFSHIRVVSSPSSELLNAASKAFVFINSTPVMPQGRYELLHYLQEVSVSCDYHRYGSLGLRESEKRNPVL